MERHAIILTLVSIMFGYLIIGDVINKLVAMYTGDYPKVQCIREVP